jgi:hypothetical protein
MTTRDTWADLPTLCRCWRRWTDVFELFARKRRGRLRVGEAAYGELYHRLRGACKALAESEPERRDYYETLDELARPWLTCRVLEQADAEILRTVLLRCQDVDRELNGRSWGAVVRRWGPRAALALAAALLASALLLAGLQLRGRYAEAVGGWWRGARQAAGGLSRFELIGLVGLLVMIGAARLLRPRSQ